MCSEKYVSTNELFWGLTSQTLRNHVWQKRSSCQHTHSTRSVCWRRCYKARKLPISSEPTGLVVLQWFDRGALTIAQRVILRRSGTYHHHHRYYFNIKRCCIYKITAIHASPDLTKTKAWGKSGNIYNVVRTEDRWVSTENIIQMKIEHHCQLIW